ncbi:hypothetical protein HAZT_HAZT008482 [Hyalella azteca]|uniref:Large ribosomal subunit protein mL50 n=1 Tax=Hyalella azteca TaxID=294128 RepID=A0A6A0H8S4_HYAAZ|nr:hypothetical protein HAZT_HAZT008482 [Hyalella azteca]
MSTGPLRTAEADLSSEVELMKKDGSHRLLDFDHESLAARGYLRNQRSYTPPPDVAIRVQRLCEEICGSTSAEFSSPDLKFSVLKRCSKEFNHTVPNSYLHSITNIDALVAFYSAPVDARVPLDRMRDIDLPKNLHVIYNYTRFHPETDTKFGGVTAFPGSSTLVTGLKTRKKYQGFRDEPEWLRYNLEQEVDRHGNPISKPRPQRVLVDQW